MWGRDEHGIHFSGLDQLGALEKRPRARIAFEQLAVRVADRSQPASGDLSSRDRFGMNLAHVSETNDTEAKILHAATLNRTC